MHGNTETETFVPPALRKPTWSRDFPRNRANWSAERDVFLWLTPRRCGGEDGHIVPADSIEATIAYYEKQLTTPPRLASKGILRRWFAKKFDKCCYHAIQTRLQRCSGCDAEDRACIEYLKQLLPKVRSYYQSREYVLSLNPYQFEAHVAWIY